MATRTEDRTNRVSLAEVGAVATLPHASHANTADRLLEDLSDIFERGFSNGSRFDEVKRAVEGAADNTIRDFSRNIVATHAGRSVEGFDDDFLVGFEGHAASSAKQGVKPLEVSYSSDGPEGVASIGKNPEKLDECCGSSGPHNHQEMRESKIATCCGVEGAHNHLSSDQSEKAVSRDLQYGSEGPEGVSPIGKDPAKLDACCGVNAPHDHLASHSENNLYSGEAEGVPSIGKNLVEIDECCKPGAETHTHNVSQERSHECSAECREHVLKSDQPTSDSRPREERTTSFEASPREEPVSSLQKSKEEGHTKEGQSAIREKQELSMEGEKEANGKTVLRVGEWKHVPRLESTVEEQVKATHPITHEERGNVQVAESRLLRSDDRLERQEVPSALSRTAGAAFHEAFSPEEKTQKVSRYDTRRPDEKGPRIEGEPSVVFARYDKKQASTIPELPSVARDHASPQNPVSSNIQPPLRRYRGEATSHNRGEASVMYHNLEKGTAKTTQTGGVSHRSISGRNREFNGRDSNAPTREASHRHVQRATRVMSLKVERAPGEKPESRTLTGNSKEQRQRAQSIRQSSSVQREAGFSPERIRESLTKTARVSMARSDGRVWQPTNSALTKKLSLVEAHLLRNPSLNLSRVVRAVRSGLSPKEQTLLRLQNLSSMTKSDPRLVLALRIAHTAAKLERLGVRVSQQKVLEIELRKLLIRFNRIPSALDPSGRVTSRRAKLIAAQVAIIEEELSRYATFELGRDEMVEEEENWGRRQPANRKRVVEKRDKRRAYQNKHASEKHRAAENVIETPKKGTRLGISNLKTGKAVTADTKTPSKSLDVVMSKEEDEQGNEYTRFAVT